MGTKLHAKPRWRRLRPGYYVHTDGHRIRTDHFPGGANCWVLYSPEWIVVARTWRLREAKRIHSGADVVL